MSPKPAFRHTAHGYNCGPDPSSSPRACPSSAKSLRLDKVNSVQGFPETFESSHRTRNILRSVEVDQKARVFTARDELCTQKNRPVNLPVRKSQSS